MQTQTTGTDINIKSAGVITLGDANNPTLTIDDMDQSGSNYGVEVDGTIYPKITGAAHGYRDLGLTGVRWTNVYATNLHGNGASITNIPYSALTGTPSIPSIPASLPAKSGFNHQFNDTSYSGSSYGSNNYGAAFSCTLTPSNSNNRVVIMASFQLKRNGSQNNNWYARARITGGGDTRSQTVRTNRISYDETGFSNDFNVIAYDGAGNTSARTYNLGVNYTNGTGVAIRNASIVAIELSSS